MTRRARVIFAVAAVALLALGLARLRFDTDVLNLLPPELPSVRGLRLYQQNFSTARQLIITVRAPDAGQAELVARSLAETLRTQTNLVHAAIWQPPWLEHPGDAAELMAYLWFNSPPEKFAALAEKLAPENLSTILDATRTRLATSMSPAEIARGSYDPFGLLEIPSTENYSFAGLSGQQLFTNPDGTFRVIFIEPAPDVSNYRAATKWLTEIHSVADAATKSFSGIRLRFTGGPAFVAEISASMERDIRHSILGTALIIGVLFWLAHRRLRPLLWLLVLLGSVLLATLAGGALIFGSLNVVSLGFAAILLGLAVDYAVVHYQEAIAQPELSIPQIRRAIAPAIFWAATTTIAAFLTLNFGGLPGLAQLGSLVALGVALAAALMIFAYLPPLFPERLNHDESKKLSTSNRQPTTRTHNSSTSKRLQIFAAAIFLFAAIFLVTRGLPRMDATANALRPRHSPAYDALAEVQHELMAANEPLWLLITGTDERAVARTLAQSELALQTAMSHGTIARYTLPTPLWPQPDFQHQNRATSQQLLARREAFSTAAATAGFTTNSLALANAMLATWQNCATTQEVFTPTNSVSRWTLAQFMATTPNNQFTHLALGLVTPATNSKHNVQNLKLPPHSVLSGWSLLGAEIYTTVRAKYWKLTVPMGALVLASLWFAFRNGREVLLSLVVLLLSTLGLLTVMQLCGWSWNLLNLMAVPLVLGTGVDYSIFMQLALRRHGGNREIVHRAVGRALLLCGGTAVAGFGSLAFSSNAGMASLGQICAVGIAFNVVISVWLLPCWWCAAREFSSKAEEKHSRPSALYGALLWRFALVCTRAWPEKFTRATLNALASIYWVFAYERRAVLVQNLLPLVNHDRATATRAAKKLRRNFSNKLADLWRYEAGLPMDERVGRAVGWENYLAAQKKYRGVLFLTPHLGNWEFGALIMRRRGLSVHAISLAEPGRNFTELRRTARARVGVETLVIGENPFGAVQIIRTLEDGGAVALLLDRPPTSSAVTVKFFGRNFSASVAAAEFARASGCALLPTYVVWRNGHYEAEILPAIDYDRPALRDREARRALTQEILRAFEPIVRQHPDQWYHFVPIWPEEKLP